MYLDSKEKYYFWLFIIILGFIGFSIFSVSFGSGEGDHIGYIADIENYGILWKPTRVNLISVVPTFSERDTSYDYGIEPELVDLAKMYQKENKKVKVYYTTKYFVWKWDYHSNTIITNIEVLEDEKI